MVDTGRMDPPLGEIHFLFLPSRDLFALRAERLRALSQGHPMGGYLAFLAQLADSQQDALDRFPPLPLADPEERALRRAHGKPLLDGRSWRRDPAWRDGLAAILRQMEVAALPAAAREAVAGLVHATGAELEERADRILAGELVSLSPGELPFVAAALQVYWVQMASNMEEEAFGRPEEAGICPVCGSHPNVGLVHARGRERGLRYLCCSLCASQWHMVRLKCSRCASTGGIDHYLIEGSNGAVKAESCDECGTYLKLLYLEKESRMEATADDLATLALDMLMDGDGKARSGPNLYFHPGGV